jgi:anti-anti-sigma factor
MSLSIQCEADESTCVLRLADEVDINSSVELKQSLVDAIASGKELHLDLQAGPSLDITAIQLLWAARHEIEQRGSNFVIAGDVPEIITSALQDAGIEPFLTPLAANPGEFAGPVKETSE